MTQYPAGEITHYGVTVPIFVDDRGHWTATYAGRGRTEESRYKLDMWLKRMTKRTATPIRFPFVSVTPSNQKHRRGVAYGIHEGTGNVLVEWDDGTKEQVKSYATGTDHLGDVPDAELATWLLLVRAYRQAEQALHAFMSDRRINLKDEVMRAADEAADKAATESQSDT